MAGGKEASLVEENCHGRKAVGPAIFICVHGNRGAPTSGEILAAIQIEGKRAKYLCFVRRLSRLGARFRGKCGVECGFLILIESTVGPLRKVAEQKRPDRHAHQSQHFDSLRFEHSANVPILAFVEYNG